MKKRQNVNPLPPQTSAPSVIVPPARPAGLLKRALTVIGVAPTRFANMYGLDVKDVTDLYHAPNDQAEAIDRHPVWASLNDYVNDQYGALTGLREEIQRKLAQDVREREARRQRTL